MKQDEILFFLGSAVIVVFAWIAFTILHNATTSTISESANQAIIPISANFDQQTIDALGKKTVVLSLNTIPSQEQKEVVVTTAPTPPIATQSATTATTGGTLQ